MARQYYVKSGTRRWPVALFDNTNLASINAFTLYQEKTGKRISKREESLFLKYQTNVEWKATRSNVVPTTSSIVVPKEKQCLIAVNCTKKKKKSDAIKLL